MSVVSSVDKTSLNKPLKVKTCTRKTKHAKSTTLKPTLGLRKIPKAKLSHTATIKISINFYLTVSSLQVTL